MGDDSSKSPLTRRVPGATRAGPASSSRPELPAELLQRMQAVVSAAHAQAKQEEQTQGKQSTAATRRSFVTGGSKPSNGVRPKLTASLQGRLSDEDAEFDTDELPRLTASGAVASAAPADTATAPRNHAAPPDQAQRPGRGDHAAAKRDRRAQRRERAAQAERERAERAQRERAAQEEAERERVREAELAARAVQVLRERERAAQEQTANEAAARAERERADKAENERVEREQAERERAERDRAARERERAAHERAAQADREHAAKKAEQERQRAAQAERERAEQEREQARRERAERESAAPGRRAAPAQAGSDNTTQLIIAASTNGSATADAATGRDGGAEQDGADGADDRARPGGQAKPNGTVRPPDQGVSATRGDVLEYPRRTAHQKPVRRRGRTIALIAAAVVIVVAGPTAVILSRHTAAPPDGSGSGLRTEAAAWISHQISPDDVVSCDLAMCQTLEANGVGTGDLLVMDSSDHNILSSQVVVSTSAIRQLFGGRLDSVYAPTVIASFGSGKARIEVRVTAPNGSAAYMSQLNTDVQERKSVGSGLAANGRVVASATGKRQMDAGQVDSRLLVGLTYLLGASSPQQKLDILAFADLGPGASPGVPLRAVYLAETGVVANVRSTLAALRSAQTDFRPAHTETVRFGGKRALYIEFAAPPRLGLLDQ